MKYTIVFDDVEELFQFYRSTIETPPSFSASSVGRKMVCNMDLKRSVSKVRSKQRDWCGVGLSVGAFNQLCMYWLKNFRNPITLEEFVQIVPKDFFHNQSNFVRGVGGLCDESLVGTMLNPYRVFREDTHHYIQGYSIILPNCMVRSVIELRGSALPHPVNLVQRITYRETFRQRLAHFLSNHAISRETGVHLSDVTQGCGVIANTYLRVILGAFAGQYDIPVNLYVDQDDMIRLR